jgi:hypothetical protein
MTSAKRERFLLSINQNPDGKMPSSTAGWKPAATSANKNM